MTQRKLKADFKFTPNLTLLGKLRDDDCVGNHSLLWYDDTYDETMINVNETLNPPKAPHTSPSCVCYGMYFVSILKTNDHDIKEYKFIFQRKLPAFYNPESHGGAMGCLLWENEACYNDSVL